MWGQVSGPAPSRVRTSRPDEGMCPSLPVDLRPQMQRCHPGKRPLRCGLGWTPRDWVQRPGLSHEFVDLVPARPKCFVCQMLKMPVMREEDDLVVLTNFAKHPQSLTGPIIVEPD